MNFFVDEFNAREQGELVAYGESLDARKGPCMVRQAYAIAHARALTQGEDSASATKLLKASAPFCPLCGFQTHHHGATNCWLQRYNNPLEIAPAQIAKIPQLILRNITISSISDTGKFSTLSPPENAKATIALRTNVEYELLVKQEKMQRWLAEQIKNGRMQAELDTRAQQT